MPGRERIFSLTTGGVVQNCHNQENSCGSQQDAHPRADAGAFGDSPDHGRGHNRADPRQGDKDAHGERVAAKDVTGICDSRAVHAGEGKPQSDSTGQHQRKAVCEQDDAEKGENNRIRMMTAGAMRGAVTAPMAKKPCSQSSAVFLPVNQDRLSLCGFRPAQIMFFQVMFFCTICGSGGVRQCQAVMIYLFYYERK